jgi:hypothetical protein
MIELPSQVALEDIERVEVIITVPPSDAISRSVMLDARWRF